MQSASSFLSFSDKELVLDEWEFLSDSGKLDLTDMILIGFFALLTLLLSVAWDFEVFALATFVLALLCVWSVITRPDTRGFVCLTNWRFLYYERAEGSRIKRRHHLVSSANLEDVLGVTAIYNEGLFGRKTVTLMVHTRYEEGVQVRIGMSGGLLGRIPAIGRLFQRTTIGKDAYAVLPVLFTLIQQRRGSIADTSTGY